MHAYWRNRRFLHATAVLVGAMVGVGIYGIPFSFAKSGWWVGMAWLVGLAVIIGLFNLLFGELTLRTQGNHQVVGYANIWLGPWGRRLMVLATGIAVYGGLLAYLIVAGEFLHNILSQFIAVDPQMYSVIFALAWSAVWLMRLRTIAGLEMILIGVYAVIIGIFVLAGLPKAQAANLTGFTAEYWYLPYGVLLFALTGANAIPIQRQLLVGKEQLMRPAILAAMGGVALMYALFATIVVAVSGDVTSPESLSGLYDFLGTPVVLLGSVMGVLTVSTSYVMLGTSLWETFHLDYRMRPSLAWLATVAPPLLFFASGLRSFIDVIGLVGAVAVGVQCALLLAAYLKARQVRLRIPEFSVRIPSYAVWALALFFVAGVVHELVVR